MSSTRSDPPAQFIRATLSGSTRCQAAGIIVRSSTPILSWCRRWVEAFDGDGRLECYRDGVLTVIVRSIREAANLEINAHGTGFIAFRGRRAASPGRKSDAARSQLPPSTRSRNFRGTDRGKAAAMAGDGLINSVR